MEREPLQKALNLIRSKTNSEFYLIRNHIDYLEATNATDEEIIKFDTLITLYEEKIKEKMERQRKK